MAARSAPIPAGSSSPGSTADRSAIAVPVSRPATAVSATSATVVAASATVSAPNRSAIPPPSSEPKPAVNPLISPRVMSPVMAAVPIPVSAAVPRVPSFNTPPNAPSKNGANASGCPVTGLIVNLPVGDNAAIPATSTGFMCTSIESP